MYAQREEHMAQNSLLDRRGAVGHEDDYRRRCEHRHLIPTERKANDDEDHVDADRQRADGVEKEQGGDTEFIQARAVGALEVAPAEDEFQRVEADIQV